MMTRSQKHKPKKPKQRVSGYWQVRPTGESIYVKGYTRKKVKPWNKGKRFVKAEVVEPRVKVHEPPATIAGYRFVERIESVEPVERIAYTIRIVALVDFNYQYPMSFRPSDFDGKPAANAKHLQYYHTSFFTTPEGAFTDFREKVPVMRAYGDINFLDIELLRVSGDGPLPEKHFKVIAEYAEPEDVPGFNRR